MSLIVSACHCAFLSLRVFALFDENDNDKDDDDIAVVDDGYNDDDVELLLMYSFLLT